MKPQVYRLDAEDMFWQRSVSGRARLLVIYPLLCPKFEELTFESFILHCSGGVLMHHSAFTSLLHPYYWRNSV